MQQPEKSPPALGGLGSAPTALSTTLHTLASICLNTDTLAEFSFVLF